MVNLSEGYTCFSIQVNFLKEIEAYPEEIRMSIYHMEDLGNKF